MNLKFKKRVLKVIQIINLKNFRKLKNQIRKYNIRHIVIYEKIKYNYIKIYNYIIYINDFICINNWNQYTMQ